MPNYHVIRNNNTGAWVVKRAGASRSSGSYTRQGVAERAARRFAANSGGGEIRIHNASGQIRHSDTVPPSNNSTRSSGRR